MYTTTCSVISSTHWIPAHVNTNKQATFSLKLPLFGNKTREEPWQLPSQWSHKSTEWMFWEGGILPTKGEGSSAWGHIYKSQQTSLLSDMRVRLPRDQTQTTSTKNYQGSRIPYISQAKCYSMNFVLRWSAQLPCSSHLVKALLSCHKWECVGTRYTVQGNIEFVSDVSWYHPLEQKLINNCHTVTWLANQVHLAWRCNHKRHLFVLAILWQNPQQKPLTRKANSQKLVSLPENGSHCIKKTEDPSTEAILAQASTWFYHSVAVPLTPITYHSFSLWKTRLPPKVAITNTQSPWKRPK